MPRVTTATKNRGGTKTYTCRRCGRVIEPGERYYKYAFRYGGTYRHCSEHYPRMSETTQSIMGEVYAAIEGVEDSLADYETVDDIVTAVESVADTARDIAEQYRDAAEAFGGMGDNADRADELEGFADELESFGPNDEPGEDETMDDVLENARSEATEALANCP